MFRFAIPALFLIGLGTFVYVLLSAGPQKTGPSGLKALAIGEMRNIEFRSDPPLQPTEPFVDADGQNVRLSDFHGEIVVLNLWATWCAPCVTEMPTLAVLQETLAEDGVRIIPVSMDRTGDVGFAKSELTRLTNDRLGFYHDASFGIAADIQASGFPTTLIYDREGEEIARYAGDTDWGSEEAIALVKAISASQTP